MCSAPDFKGSQNSLVISGFSNLSVCRSSYLKHCLILNYQEDIIRLHNEFFSPRKLIYDLKVIYFSMTMSKNEDMEKDDKDKNKQYQKREDEIFSFSRKLRKIAFWTYIAYVIVLTIYFQLVTVMVLTLLFLGYFRKLWRICDLISIYYISLENCPGYLWIEIFYKLRIYCWVCPNFCWGYFAKLLVTFLAKIKTTVL